MKDGKTHFADNDTLDYITKLECELAVAQHIIAEATRTAGAEKGNLIAGIIHLKDAARKNHEV